jgi:hypothetical protein
MACCSFVPGPRGTPQPVVRLTPEHDLPHCCQRCASGRVGQWGGVTWNRVKTSLVIIARTFSKGLGDLGELSRNGVHAHDREILRARRAMPLTEGRRGALEGSAPDNGPAAGTLSAVNVETLHPAEIKHAVRVRSFHLMQSFHVLATGRTAAPRERGTRGGLGPRGPPPGGRHWLPATGRKLS